MPFSHIQSTDHDQLEDLAGTLARANRVVVITGAGISTSCGIPDFRSQDGLYSLLQSTGDEHTQGPGRAIKGAELFNSSVFRDEDKSRTFYRFMASLREKCMATKRTSATHKFIRKLQDRQKLVRCYTQNIDGFEAREGLSSQLSHGAGSKHRMAKKALETMQSNLTLAPGGIHDAGCEAVSLHGDLATLRCTVCAHIQEWTSDAQSTFLKGEVPSCPECDTTEMVRQALGKRSVRTGSLRPNVILYGEDHPQTDTISQIRHNDLNMKPDLLLVMGTSLKVDGLKMLVREFAQAVHAKKGGKAVFVNLSKPASSIWGDVFDSWVDMDCDNWVHDMKARRKELWQKQTRIDEITPVLAKKSLSTKHDDKTTVESPKNVKIRKPLQVLVCNEKDVLDKLKAKCLKRPASARETDSARPKKRQNVAIHIDKSLQVEKLRAKNACSACKGTTNVSSSRPEDRVLEPSSGSGNRQNRRILEASGTRGCQRAKISRESTAVTRKEDDWSARMRRRSRQSDLSKFADKENMLEVIELQAAR